MRLGKSGGEGEGLKAGGDGEQYSDFTWGKSNPDSAGGLIGLLPSVGRLGQRTESVTVIGVG
jgi:hypothetical protein